MKAIIIEQKNKNKSSKMQKLSLAILLIVNLNCLINGEFNCKQADVVTDFQRDAFMGKWYEILRNPTIYDATFKCMVFNVTSLKPDTIHIIVHGKNIYSDNTVVMDSYLKHPVDTKIGYFSTHIVESQVEGSFDLGLIDVDYDSYAIFQGCDLKEEIEYVWIMTRERIVSDEQFQGLYDILEKRGINTKFLTKIYQKNCDN